MGALQSLRSETVSFCWGPSSRQLWRKSPSGHRQDLSWHRRDPPHWLFALVMNKERWPPAAFACLPCGCPLPPLTLSSPLGPRSPLTGHIPHKSLCAPRRGRVGKVYCSHCPQQPPPWFSFQALFWHKLVSGVLSSPQNLCFWSRLNPISNWFLMQEPVQDVWQAETSKPALNYFFPLQIVDTKILISVVSVWTL